MDEAQAQAAVLDDIVEPQRQRVLRLGRMLARHILGGGIRAQTGNPQHRCQIRVIGTVAQAAQLDIDARDLAAFTVGGDTILLGRETIYRDGERVGWLTSGGYGYTVDSGLPMHFQDAKLFEIGGGAMEVQRDIIARGMGL